MKKNKTIIVYLPLILTVLYLLISYLMYRFGGYVWPFRNDLLTAIFMLACILFFSLGYVFATKKRKKDRRYNNVILELPANTVLLICCIVSLIIFFPTCKTYTNSWYPPIISTLLNPKETYYEMTAAISDRSGIRIWALLDVFSYVLLPLTLWAWEKIKKPVRLLAVALALGYTAIYISSARNIALAVQMLSVVAVWFSVLCISMFENNKNNLKAMSILTLCYICLVAFFFQFTMSSRTGYSEEIYVALKEDVQIVEQGISEENSAGLIVSESSESQTSEVDKEVGDAQTSEAGKESVEEIIDFGEVSYFEEIARAYNEADGQNIGIGVYKYNGLEITAEQYKNFISVFNVFPNYTDKWSKAYANMNDIFVRILPASLSNLYVVGTTYITNGYHCLTVALHSDHVWTYGIGHSMFLSSYVDRFLGTDISNSTYYKRLTSVEEYPLISSSLWPSTFTQLADDMTFVGVVIFMAILGYVVAKIWLSMLIQKNYWAVLLLGQVILGVLFLPANNILENSGGFFVTFWTLVLMWMLSQLSIKKKIERRGAEIE